MIKTITKTEHSPLLRSVKFRESASLAVLSAFSFALFGLRVYLSGDYFFLFLLWNLFLAFVPWAISTLLVLSEKLRNLKVITFAFMILWVLFFPNAPYIITDLFHLQYRHDMPVWFDLILITSFAWTGLLFGFASMRDIAGIMRGRLSIMMVNLLTGGFLFVTAFGIYIGRYLRWNSWDIVSRPMTLLGDVSDILINPMAHPKAWGMTLLLGAMLNIVYWTFKPFSKSAAELSR